MTAALLIWLPVALFFGTGLVRNADDVFGTEEPPWLIALVITIVAATWPVWTLLLVLGDARSEPPPPEF